MEFPQCKVKSIKADIVAGEITIVFTLKLNDDSLESAEALSMYVDKDQGKVEVRVIPDQPPLLTLGLVTADEVTAEAGGDDE